MRKKFVRLFFTIGVSGMAFVINYGITLVLTSYLTDRVGADAYGFVTLAKHVAQYATIVTLALNSFSARYVAVNYHQNNIKQANVFYSSTFYGNLAIGIVLLLIALAMVAFLENLLRIPEMLVDDVKLLFLLVFVNFFISTICNVYGTGAYVVNRLDIVGVFKVLSYLVEAAVLILCYHFFEVNIFYVGFALLSAGLVVVLSNRWICRHYVPELRIQRSCYRFGAVKTLVSKGIWTSINEVGSLLHSGLDLLICDLMLTPLAMGQLSIVKSLDLIFLSLYQLVGHAFQPSFLKSYAQNDRAGLLSDLKLSMRISGCLGNLAFAGFTTLGFVYYQLWLPNQDTQLLYHLSVITVLSSIACGSMNPLYYIYTLTTKQKVPCIITIGTGVLNVVGMVVLIRYTALGVDAVVWTTTVLVWVIDFITNPLYMAHVLNMPWHCFYPNILRNLLSCAAMLALFKGLSLLYMPNSWATLILCALLYTILGGIVHFSITFSHKERSKYMRRLKQKLKRG